MDRLHLFTFIGVVLLTQFVLFTQCDRKVYVFELRAIAFISASIKSLPTVLPEDLKILLTNELNVHRRT